MVIMWPGRSFINQWPSVEKEKAVMGGPDACLQGSALKPMVTDLLPSPPPNMVYSFKTSYMQQGFSSTKDLFQSNK